jgi:hypothetical protein
MKNVFRTIRALSDGMSPPKLLSKSPRDSPTKSSPISTASSPRSPVTKKDEPCYSFVIMGPGDVGM